MARRSKEEPQAEGLFDIERPVQVERGEGVRKARTQEAKPDAVKWTRTKPKVKPDKCDACVQAMIDGGKWTAPGVVVFTRTHKGETLRLCWDHAVPLRTADGIETKRGGR